MNGETDSTIPAAARQDVQPPLFEIRAADPWAHRSSGMRCHTCMWFVEKVDGIVGTKVKGRCRRHAPTMNGYPVVFTDDWCGDHKLA